MDKKAPEPLHTLLPVKTWRSRSVSSDLRSLPVVSSVFSTLRLDSFAVTGLVLTSISLAGLALTGCSASPSYSARAETAAGASADSDASVSSDDSGAVSGVRSGGSSGVSSSVSSGDSSGSSPGGGASAPYSGSGVVNDSPSTSGSSDPDTAVSSGPLADQHEWTQEEMLMAKTMPETQEERDFVSKHKAAESIRTWTLGEFQDYTNSAMGRSQMLQEGRRWVSIKATLKEQLALGQDFLAGGGKAKSKKAKSVDASRLPEAIPEYLMDDGVFVGAECATTFDRLKECRQDITDLCRSIEGIKKIAKKRGRLEALERSMNSQ